MEARTIINEEEAYLDYGIMAMTNGINYSKLGDFDRARYNFNIAIDNFNIVLRFDPEYVLAHEYLDTVIMRMNANEIVAGIMRQDTPLVREMRSLSHDVYLMIIERLLDKFYRRNMSGGMIKAEERAAENAPETAAKGEAAAKGSEAAKVEAEKVAAKVLAEGEAAAAAEERAAEAEVATPAKAIVEGTPPAASPEQALNKDKVEEELLESFKGLLFRLSPFMKMKLKNSGVDVNNPNVEGLKKMFNTMDPRLRQLLQENNLTPDQITNVLNTPDENKLNTIKSGLNSVGSKILEDVQVGKEINREKSRSFDGGIKTAAKAMGGILFVMIALTLVGAMMGGSKKKKTKRKRRKSRRKNKC